MGLETIEIVLWAEDEFGIELPDDEMEEILTVGEFCKYLAERLALKDGILALPYRRIFEKVASRLESEYKIPRHFITEQAQFYKDLGLG